jgi:penicillin-binding protein 2
MPPDLEDRRPTITPQLAVRVAVLGGIAFVLFAIVFFRLWFLQVLSGDDYVVQARENRVRKVRIEAPRGDIVDRKGTTLVTTRVAPVARIVPSSLPAAELEAAEAYRKEVARAERERLAARASLDRLEDRSRLSRAERRERRRLRRAAETARTVPVPPLPPGERELRRRFARLGKVLGVRSRTIHRRVIRGIADAPYSNVTVKTDISRGAFNYLRERRKRFPGVEVEKLYLREYPHDELGAQLFGTLREIAPEEIGRKRYRGVAAGTRIGKDGIEERYDAYLRGQDGYSRVVINALGNRDDRRRTSAKDPVQGQQLKLTLDLRLQAAADRAIQRGIVQARANYHDAKAGAYVAMDPRNGEILALGSYPSFDANLFAKPLDQETYEQLNSDARGAPLFNRAVSATYPTGSTFKPITALAALESGVLGLGEPIFDDGAFELGNRVFRNAKGARFGSLTITPALQVSSDVFFYTLGDRANEEGPVIQRWARRLGLGRRTGVDLPGEPVGLVPDRRWVEREYAKYERCARRAKVPERTPAALYACGGVEDGWTVGDNVNLAIGQGFLQASPLQMAVAYSALANGGRVVRPHLGMEIEDGDGHMIEEVRHPARRRVAFDPANRDAIMEGLRRAAMEPKGTSYGVFGEDWPSDLPVYGKTGTVERPGQDDQSWYAAYVPHKTRPIVVVTTIERGGFGAETAAPAARLILSQWFNLGKGDFKASANTD